ncbi:hypothetical protein CAEBREN_16353 [Caenorhabditis brenneri]|uniref:Uncharacterized protein n=1 Tax=Caenorhabditis brenneri TaxID=135651 RepID=G0NZJ9_CAEBE|nr:hypothetical protein CAEBREN_16353 [Caenorhabditis brenneri]
MVDALISQTELGFKLIQGTNPRNMQFTPTAMFFVNCTQSREVSSFIHNLWSIPSKMYYHERGREREQQLYERHILGKTIKRIKGDMLTQLLEKGRFTDDIRRWVTGSSDITEYSKVLPFLNVSLPIQNEVVSKESFNFTMENGRSTKSVALQTEGSGESNIETSTTISEGSDSSAAQPIHTSTSETYHNSSSTPENSESSEKDVNPSSQDSQTDKTSEEMREEIVNSTLEHIALTTSVPVQTIKSEASTTSIIDTEQSIKTLDAPNDLILATGNPEEHHFSAQSTQNSLLIENNTEPTTKSSSETHNSSTPEISKPSQEDVIVFHVSYSNHTDDDISILIKNSSDIFDVHNSSSELPDALHTTIKTSFNLKKSNTEMEVQNPNTMTTTSETYNISTLITLPSQEDRLISSVEYGNQTDDFASTLIKSSSDIFDVHNSSSELPDALNTSSKPSTPETSKSSQKSTTSEPIPNPESEESNTEASENSILDTGNGVPEIHYTSTPITSQSSQQDGTVSRVDFSNQTDDFTSTLIKNSSDIFDVHNSSSELPDSLHTTPKPSFNSTNFNTETEITNLYTLTTTSETYDISTPMTSQSLQEDGLISSDESGNQTDDVASTLIKDSSIIFDVHNSSSELPDALNTTSKPLFSLKNSNTETEVRNSNTITSTLETYKISTPGTPDLSQEDGIGSSVSYSNQTDEFTSTSKPLLNLKNPNTKTKAQNSNTVGNESYLPDDPDNATRTLAMDDYLNLRPPSSIEASNETTLAGHSVNTPAPTTVRQSLLSRLAPSTLHARDRMHTSTELPKTTTRYLSKCAKDRLLNNKSVREF